MPTTLKIVNHPAENWLGGKVTTTEGLLKSVSPKQHQRTTQVIQSSFGPSLLGESHISSSNNGFVWAAIHAYSSHHHLVIRPDDVWLTIINQLGFYINANAESLRSYFVDHHGQKHLEIGTVGTLGTVDFGQLADQMTHLISKNVKDPMLRDFVMPSFTTTTETDTAAAAVLFMGAMQKYFSYGFTIECGIPSVTLLGEVSDWESIVTKLDRLEQLGEEPKQFADLLRPIVQNMVRSFTHPDDPEVIKFWNSVADKDEGSGYCDYTGWIAAFCFWDEEGKALLGTSNGPGYPAIDSEKIPSGFGSVPVTVTDDGEKLQCTMIAGSVGIQAYKSATTISSLETAPNDTTQSTEETRETDTGLLTVIQPLLGWWICENESAEIAEARETEISTLQEELDLRMEAYFKDYDPESDHKKDEWLQIGRLESRLRELEV
ncbi:hypothetical protein VHEMI04127 [[Torrubiella] hemipterigena]|uniref:DUF4419 domain-containing protein n=1 Tax=[Torrubiella] hemipterigena TaxID=1531966 RepID=A0A0A1T0G5_9HYPO|nr:hypothetical protein VHEMI04127 [[Torrubiella] hemipterigena]